MILDLFRHEVESVPPGRTSGSDGNLSFSQGIQMNTKIILFLATAILLPSVTLAAAWSTHQNAGIQNFFFFSTFHMIYNGSSGSF
jgi:hypothetical protein